MAAWYPRGPGKWQYIPDTLSNVLSQKCAQSHSADSFGCAAVLGGLLSISLISTNTSMNQSVPVVGIGQGFRALYSHYGYAFIADNMVSILSGLQSKDADEIPLMVRVESLLTTTPAGSRPIGQSPVLLPQRLELGQNATTPHTTAELHLDREMSDLLLLALPGFSLDIELATGINGIADAIHSVTEAAQMAFAVKHEMLQILLVEPVSYSLDCLSITLSAVEIAGCNTSIGSGACIGSGQDTGVLGCVSRWKMRVRVGLPGNSYQANNIESMFTTIPSVEHSSLLSIHDRSPSGPVRPLAEDARLELFCMRYQNATAMR